MIPIGFLEIGLRDLLEIVLIATILYYLYRWIRGTYAIQAAIGLLFIILINVIVSVLGFTTLSFMLRSLLDVGILALFIIFQPEIRKLLYNLGQNTRFDRFTATTGSDTAIDEVVDAVRSLAQTKTGALIVFAKSSSLQDLVDAGIRLDSEVSSELLQTIFQKDTALHDGAVILRNNRIVAAGCYLPISQNPRIATKFGTRHRAALGINETNNVLVVVVSEETGRISVAVRGELKSGLSIQELRILIKESLGGEETATIGGFGANSTGVATG